MIYSAEEFFRLRRSEDPDEYRRASSDEAPLGVWLSVVERFPEMRSWVAHNKTVPLEILERLAVDLDAGVRAAVASKRKLSFALQVLLRTDADASVRERLACNEKCDPEILRLLASDAEESVRSAAIRRLKERESAL